MIHNLDATTFTVCLLLSYSKILQLEDGLGFVFVFYFKPFQCVKALTDVKGADGERSSDQLIHHHFCCHGPDSAPWQHPLQPSQPLVVKVGVETEAHSGHPRRLTQVDAGSSFRCASSWAVPAQQTLLDQVSRGEECGVAQNVADVRVSFEHSPGPSHGQPGWLKALMIHTWRLITVETVKRTY